MENERERERECEKEQMNTLCLLLDILPNFLASSAEFPGHQSFYQSNRASNSNAVTPSLPERGFSRQTHPSF